MPNAVAITPSKTPNPVLVDSHNTPSSELAKWIYKDSLQGKVFTKYNLISMIQRIKQGATVYEKDVPRFVQGAREYLESKMQMALIWDYQKQVYKIAEGIERPRYVGKVCHIFIEWQKRAMRALGILSADEMEEAYKECLLRIQRDGEKNSSFRKRFQESWLEHLKTIRAEKREAQKLLTKKVGG